MIEISPIEYVRLPKNKRQRARSKNEKIKFQERYKMIDAAEIKIWDKLVGAVRWDANKRLASFQYGKKFLAKAIELSPIKMPIKNGDRIYSFPELRRTKDEQIATFDGLPGLLADALPDRYGNQLIDIWLAKNGRPPNSMNPVEKLCFIGSRGDGVRWNLNLLN